jgi:hypothetical protein
MLLPAIEIQVESSGFRRFYRSLPVRGELLIWAGIAVKKVVCVAELHMLTFMFSGFRRALG